MTRLAEFDGIVDLERWPIDELDGARGGAMLAGCRAEMARTGCCNMAGFLSASGVATLAREAEALLAQAYWKNTTRNAYFSADDPSLPADHPRRAFFPVVMGQVAGDLIPEGSWLDRLYTSRALIEFVRRVLDLPALYVRADVFQRLNLIVLPDGGVQPWHYNQNHFSVTLLLQAASEGGAFEFVPGLKSADGEDVDAVARLLQGEHARVVRPTRDAGTLTLFRGENAMHRVTAVRGPKARVTAILSYDEEPGMWAPDEIDAMIYGPRVAALLAKRA